MISPANISEKRQRQTKSFIGTQQSKDEVIPRTQSSLAKEKRKQVLSPKGKITVEQNLTHSKLSIQRTRVSLQCVNPPEKKAIPSTEKAPKRINSGMQICSSIKSDLKNKFTRKVTANDSINRTTTPLKSYKKNTQSFVVSNPKMQTQESMKFDSCSQFVNKNIENNDLKQAKLKQNTCHIQKRSICIGNNTSANSILYLKSSGSKSKINTDSDLCSITIHPVCTGNEENSGKSEFRIPCSNCGRRYNESTLNKHIEACKNKPKNLSFTSFDNQKQSNAL